MDLSALNFKNSLIYKRFEFNLNAKPRILNQNSDAKSHQIAREENKEASVSEKREYEKVFNQRVSEEVKRAEAGMMNIYFRDPITKKLTRSALSGESLSALGRELGSDDMKKRADGSYILSGKAENFVAGWYADIAYTRGYLKADKNNDGYFDEYELSKVRSGYTAHILQNADTGEIATDASFVESYIKIGGKMTSAFGKEDFRQSLAYSQREFGSKTIGIELDKSIKNDKNLDGKIDYEEIGGEKLLANVIKLRGTLFESVKFMHKLMNEHIKKGINSDDNIILLDDEKTTDMWLKKILDKLGKGTKFDNLTANEQVFLRFHLADKIFDLKTNEQGEKYLEFNEEKFQNFYTEFKENFKRKSADFLGLLSDEASRLDYENLSKIVDELYATFTDTNSTSISTIGETISLRKKFIDTEV